MLAFDPKLSRVFGTHGDIVLVAVDPSAKSLAFCGRMVCKPGKIGPAL